MHKRASELIGFHDMSNDDVMPTESPFDVERVTLFSEILRKFLTY